MNRNLFDLLKGSKHGLPLETPILSQGWAFGLKLSKMEFCGFSFQEVKNREDLKEGQETREESQGFQGRSRRTTRGTSFRWFIIWRVEVYNKIRFETPYERMSQLSEIISELSQNCLYLKALKQAKRLYTVNVNDLKAISPFSVFQLLKKLNCKADPSGALPEES